MTFEEMYRTVRYRVDQLPPPSDYYTWYGSSGLTNNNKPMLEQAEKTLKLAEMVPAIQGKVDSLASKVEKMKMISPDDYVECENCGLLVNKNKAQVFSSVKDVERFNGYILLYTGKVEPVEKEAVLHHLCQHCDMKKFKKENKY